MVSVRMLDAARVMEHECILSALDNLHNNIWPITGAAMVDTALRRTTRIPRFEELPQIRIFWQHPQDGQFLNPNSSLGMFRYFCHCC